jgi:transcriptional regulator with XRE-family HTH domain
MFLLRFDIDSPILMRMEPNLKAIVQTLLASGMTQKAIATRVGCSQPTISDIASGKIGTARPSYRIAAGLVALLDEIKSTPKPFEATA